jgi:hypothetical protein
LPLANPKGWNNTNVTVNFTGTDSLSGLAGCSSPVELTNDGTNQSASGTCTDKAGNVSPSAPVTGINIDKTSPAIAITSPANGANVTSPLAVTGTVTDSLSGTSAVTCNGTAASVNGTSFSCSVPLVTGSNTINAIATDVAGNIATASVTVLNSSVGTITMITPNATQQGQVFTVTVTGANSHFAQGSTGVDFGSGTGADNVTVNGPLSLTARVTVNASAIVGTRTLTVTTGTEVLVLDSALSVLEGPKISASADRPPNAAGWYNADVTVTFTCSDSVIGIRTCPPATVVSTEGNHQVISGTAVNNAGTQVTTSVTLSIDKTPPIVTFTAPANGSILLVPTVNVAANVTDTLSGLSTAACNGSATTVSEGSIVCTAALVAGANSIAATATDNAGNSRTTTLPVTYSRAPKVKITSPAPLSYLSLSPTTVTGTVDDPAAVVTVNSLSAPVSNGQFSVTVPLAEGPTIIAASATAAGGAVGTDSVEVTLDTTPPHVHITSPPDHFVTTEAAVSVAGIVNDIVVGTVNDQQAQVSVNSLPAQVGNRTFLTSNVPLAIGDNLIRAVARDRVGNTVAEEITVTRQTATAAGIRVISGNNQIGVIGALLASPLVVSLTDGSGNPSANKKVIFKVTQDDGLVQVDAGTPAPSVIALTDAQGRATVNWKLGLRAGAGSNSVEAYAVGFDGTAMFSATGIQGAAAKIVVDTGNDQIGAAGQPLPRPLIAVVVDSGNNRLGGIPVTFTVKEGGGNFAGQPSFAINTDSDGRAAATLTLGLQEGNANNVVLAGFTSNPGPPAGFTASSRVAGDPLKTKVTGVVLDNSNVPIPGVTIRAALTSQINTNKSIIASLPSVQTDSQGQFVLNQAPVGYIKLLIDGLTATRPGTYPMLEYDFVTVAGQDNNVGQPIYLLPLNEQNKLCVTASTGGGTLTVADAPGFSLTFSPGQVTFPGGSKEGCISVTVVHGDKVPMVPGFGQQPRFIVTIQPPGAAFNPPATITMPNVDGLRPREVTEMYSFDHDINSFVAIGTGVVSDDGQVIRSSPGVGVLKAGWHCGGNPTSTGSAANCAQCKMCDGVSCVPNPAGGTCDDGKFCTDGDFCSNGTCISGSPKPDIPGVTLSMNVDIEPSLGPIRGFLKTVFGPNPPDFTLSITGSKQDIQQCCEVTKSMSNNTTGSITITGSISSPDIPIPGLAVALPFGISAGLFANISGSVGAGLGGSLDRCTNTGTGALSGTIGISGAVKAQLTLPGNVASASASGTIGASCGFTGPIQSSGIPCTGTCGTNGLILGYKITLVNFFTVDDSMVVLPPDTLAPINFTIPNPF